MFQYLKFLRVCLTFLYILPLISTTQVSLPDYRIVGGQIAYIENYPYQLSLLYRGVHVCGASLLHPKWAVTAAHCVYQKNGNLYSIRAGSSLNNAYGQVVRIKNVIIHPLYNSNTIDFDVAILELLSPVTASNTKAIALPKQGSSIPEYASAIVTGWGFLAENGPAGNHLQVLRVPILPSNICRNIYGPTSITPRMMCAGYVWSGGRDTCYGDSGGPLVVDGVLYGVVSWGYGCARLGYPGVYANVPVLTRFIRSVTNL